MIGFLLFALFLWQKAWSDKDAIRHDMTSYYAYLNAAVFHQDLTLSFDDGSYGDQFAWTTPAKNGKVIRMTMGVSLMESPLFLLADVGAGIFGLDRNAYSPYYVFSLFLGSFLYLLWGLWYIFKLVAACFSERSGILVVLALALGTNLYYYTYEEALMAHGFNFFLYSALLYFTLSWHQSPSGKTAAKLGIILGLLVLIRPIHVLAILIPLLYDAQNRAKWLQVKKHIRHFLIAILCAFIVLSPQLIYWKYLSGNWLYYSYGDEHFFFDAPMILKGLFGFRKGWFIYTPLMILALLGLWPFLRRNRPFALLFALFLPAYIYTVFSWWCWWYGGGFGSRPMIDILPLMALPLATFIHIMSGYKRLLAIFLVLGTMGLNLFQTKQYKTTLLHWDGMTWSLYKRTFLETRWPADYENLISPPDYAAAKEGKRDI
ncbi:MAG: glycosyltransferase family 39 protein [Bacteroidia bacterium]